MGIVMKPIPEQPPWEESLDTLIQPVDITVVRLNMSGCHTQMLALQLSPNGWISMMQYCLQMLCLRDTRPQRWVVSNPAIQLLFLGQDQLESWPRNAPGYLVPEG